MNAADKKKTRKPPKDSRLMHLAQKENFAIFMLKGRSTNLFAGLVPKHIIEEIDYWQAIAIKKIKRNQQARNPNRKIKP